MIVRQYTVFICELCKREFKTQEECEKHQQEYAKITEPIFDVGDIVFAYNQSTMCRVVEVVNKPKCCGGCVYLCQEVDEHLLYYNCDPFQCAEENICKGVNENISGRFLTRLKRG